MNEWLYRSSSNRSERGNADGEGQKENPPTDASLTEEKEAAC